MQPFFCVARPVQDDQAGRRRGGGPSQAVEAGPFRAALALEPHPRRNASSGASALDLFVRGDLDRFDEIASERGLISWGSETRALLLSGALSAENRAEASSKLGRAEREVRSLRSFAAAERAYEARLDQEFQDYHDFD